ncbi:MAG: RsmD family RNA methyltransferase [Myxococcota bacterium]
MNTKSVTGKTTIEGRVRALARGGDSAIETPLGIVFARGALPGEVVVLDRVRRTRGTLQGRVVEVLHSSEERVNPPCEIADTCGGCPFMHASARSQREAKTAMLTEAVLASERSTSNAPEVEWIESGPKLGYRRRARLHFSGARLGYRPRGDRALVDVKLCLVLVETLREAVSEFRTRVSSHVQGEGTLRLGMGTSGLAVIWMDAQDPQPPALYSQLESWVEEGGLAGASLRAGGASVAARFGDTWEWIPRDTQVPMIGTEGGFSQANDPVNQALIGHVTELADCQDVRVLELHAGSGNLTLALATLARHVVAVESHPEACRALRQNIESLPRGRVRVIEGDALHEVKGPPVEVVVLDPPRAGAKHLIASIVKRRPSRIVYVSCDTASLKRDLFRFAGLGYRVDRALAFDMFPQTAHLESVVRLIPLDPLATPSAER